MKLFKNVALMSLMLMSVGLLSNCGKKKKNAETVDQGPPPPSQPGYQPPPGPSDPGNPYGNYDVSRQPAKVEFYRGTPNCFNYRDEAIGCGDVVARLQSQGIYPDPRIPYMEYWLDGMQPGGNYQGQYQYQYGQGNWGNYGYPGYSGVYQYPYGTYSPSNSGSNWQVYGNFQGNWGNQYRNY